MMYAISFILLAIGVLGRLLFTISETISSVHYEGRRGKIGPSTDDTLKLSPANWRTRIMDDWSFIYSFSLLGSVQSDTHVNYQLEYSVLK